MLLKFAIGLVPTIISQGLHRTRGIPWQFLKHRTFNIYSIAIILQACGYGIPQTFLTTYAHDITLVSQTSATLLLTPFNIPGIVASSFFGYLSDNKRFPLSATTVIANAPSAPPCLHSFSAASHHKVVWYC